MENMVLRRTAIGVFLFGLAVFLFGTYVGLVFWNNSIDVGAESIASVDLYVWVLVLALLLALVFSALLILYFVRPAAASPEEGLESAEGETQWEPVPEAATDDAQAVWGDEPEALLVKCSNCQHEFDLPYSTERPLVGACPNCGEEAVLEEGEEVLAAGGDPIIDIEGIGPVFAEKLQRAGVYTTEQLRQGDVARLAETTGIPESNLRSWQAMSDLLRVPGVGKQFAELLARAGVEGVPGLAQQTPKRLATLVKAYIESLESPPTKGRVDAARAQKWIREARKLAPS